MKKKLLVLLSLCLTIVAIYFVFCRYKNTLPNCLRVGDTEISVDIADTPPSQARGLSGRSSISDTEGMLFLFPRDGKYGFWMKDMQFPIDIIWLDKDWIVIEITSSLDPSTYPDVSYSQDLVRAVLELSAGFSERHSVEIGDKVTLCSK